MGTNSEEPARGERSQADFYGKKSSECCGSTLMRTTVNINDVKVFSSHLEACFMFDELLLLAPCLQITFSYKVLPADRNMELN